MTNKVSGDWASAGSPQRSECEDDAPLAPPLLLNVEEESDIEETELMPDNGDDRVPDLDEDSEYDSDEENDDEIDVGDGPSSQDLLSGHNLIDVRVVIEVFYFIILQHLLCL